MSYLSSIKAAAPAATRSGPAGVTFAALLAIFATLVALRLPMAWVEGRFQDEEATVFLAYAWHFPSEALFRSFGGYLNIAANGVTLLLAELVKGGTISLERAPYFTMAAGLLAQLIPALLILMSRSPWLADLRTRIVALLVLVLMPATEEVFLNVLHIQFHLALAVALILALDRSRGRMMSWFEGAILVVAPLCGPGAIVFLPLLALRAIVDRDAGRWRQFALLGIGAAIQMLFFYVPTAMRGVPFDPLNLLASLFIRLLALPLGGVSGANRFSLAAAESMFFDKTALWLIGLLSLGLFGILFRESLKQRDSAFWLFSAALSVAVVSLGFGIVTGAAFAPFFVLAGPRYNYLPQVLLGLFFLCLAMRADPVQRRMPRVLVALFLFVGAVHYLQPFEDYGRGPSWLKEVAAWRKDPDHQLTVWPHHYSADLSNKPRRCSENKLVTASWEAPRYCQEGWLTSFTVWHGPASPKP